MHSCNALTLDKPTSHIPKFESQIVDYITWAMQFDSSTLCLHVSQKRELNNHMHPPTSTITVTEAKM